MTRTSSDRFAVGLTGGVGSGKSTVAALFAARGAAVVDTDAIAHALTAPAGAAMPAIAERFGAGFVASDGSLDRAKMRQRIFADADAKTALEAILHPLIRSDCDRLAAAAHGPYLMFVVPLLVESGNWYGRVDRVVVVDCDEETQIARVMRRNGFSRAQVLAIIAHQARRAQRLARADDVVVNDGAAAAQLSATVDALHDRYLEMAKNRGV